MNDTAEQELADRGQRWARAELAGDAVALDALAARDLHLVGPVGFVLDRSQWVNRYQQPGGLRLHSLEWTDTTVRRYGDTAVVIGVQTQQGSYGGNPADGRFRVTQVWVREDGAWKLASLHFSPVGGPPPFTAARPASATAGGGDRR